MRLPNLRRGRRSPGDLACEQVVELVTAYLEGAMAPQDRKRFERHIAACEGCTLYLTQMRETLRTLGRIPPEQLTPKMRSELESAFREWHAEARP